MRLKTEDELKHEKTVTIEVAESVAMALEAELCDERPNVSFVIDSMWRQIDQLIGENANLKRRLRDG